MLGVQTRVKVTWSVLLGLKSIFPPLYAPQLLCIELSTSDTQIRPTLCDGPTKNVGLSQSYYCEKIQGIQLNFITYEPLLKE